MAQPGPIRKKASVPVFLAVGCVGFATDSGAYALASLFLPPVGARACSIWLAIGVTWGLNRRFAFTPPAEKSLLREYLHYLLSSLCGAVVNYLSFLGLLAVLQVEGVMEYAAIFASSAIAAAVNFLLYKHVVFAHPEKQLEPDDPSCA